jgi:hypothetical protein
MNATHAAIRLWLFGSVFWLVFWIWTYATKCIHSGNGTLLCPTASGDVLIRTDYPHIVYQIFGAPILSLTVGFLFWCLIKATFWWLRSKKERSIKSSKYEQEKQP